MPFLSGDGTTDQHTRQEWSDLALFLREPYYHVENTRHRASSQQTLPMRPSKQMKHDLLELARRTSADVGGPPIDAAAHSSVQKQLQEQLTLLMDLHRHIRAQGVREA